MVTEPTNKKDLVANTIAWLYENPSTAAIVIIFLILNGTLLFVQNIASA